MTTSTKTTQPQNGPLAVRPLTVEVRSETDQTKAYTVTLPYCPCPDFFYRRGNLNSWACKHLRAAMGLVGATSLDTSRLDEEAACELLTDLRVSDRTAAAALIRARQNVQGTVELAGGGIVVILYDRRNDIYDVRLPA